MLTFISGWRTKERDQALLNNRTPHRNAAFFVENSSNFPDLLPDAPIIDVWRNGRLDFKLDGDRETIVRVNYDTDQDLIRRAVSHTLLTGSDAQIIVTFDAIDSLHWLFPALRAADSLLTADERFDAPAGDRVLFTRGGSFRWVDRILESQTALLEDSNVLDAGLVPEIVPDDEGY